jgi:hypothetical protein
MGERRVAYRVLMEKLGGRPRRRWEDDINMDVWEMVRGMDWINPPYDRDRWRTVVNAVMNLRVP